MDLQVGFRKDLKLNVANTFEELKGAVHIYLQIKGKYVDNGSKMGNINKEKNLIERTKWKLLNWKICKCSVEHIL